MPAPKGARKINSNLSQENPRSSAFIRGKTSGEGITCQGYDLEDLKNRQSTLHNNP